jgi:hypothetical protein
MGTRATGNWAMRPLPLLKISLLQSAMRWRLSARQRAAFVAPHQAGVATTSAARIAASLRCSRATGTSSASIDLLMRDRTPLNFGGIDGQSDEEENQTQGRGVDESDAC